jgi:spermidine synthase
VPDNAHTEHDRSGIPWILLIYFGSGACSLIDEVIWVRLLKLTLGNTVYASGIVVSVFMGGLALGALLMGRYADRVRRPLKLYVLLELGVTVSALAVPLLLVGADRIYRWVFVNLEPSPWLLLVMQSIVSAALLLVPTLLMGSTLPLLARHVTTLADRAGRLVGRLYAVNMFGAVAGCYLAGFYFIRIAGVMGSLYIAAAVNLLVALGGWILSRREPSAAAAPAKTPTLPERTELRPGAIRHLALAAAVLVSGLVSIGYEIVWFRSLGLLVGGYTYVFSAVLTVYLIGNVVGVWIGSRLSRRIERPLPVYGSTLACLGLLGVVHVTWAGKWYTELAPAASESLDGLVRWLGSGTTAAPFVHAVPLFLLPSIVMGIGFPLALQAWAQARQRVGYSTGTVYGINTIGAVLGGLLTSFLLIPGLGLQWAVTLLGLSAVWSGVLVIGTSLDPARKLARGLAALVGIGLTGTVFVLPADGVERHFVLDLDGEILAVHEGATTTVAVTANDAGLRLTSDNLIIAGDGADRSAQQTLGHLGMLLNPRARKVLSVGFGGGETTACLARHEPERIDCVEIAPELVHIALEHFEHINLGDRLGEAVNMIYMDARNFLHLTDRRYDLIINDSNNHDLSGSAPLFTREHFRAALDHLAPGGLFITKLHYRAHPRSSLESVLGTFVDAFPHVTVWFPVTKPFAMFYLVGSLEPQRFSPGEIDRLLQRDDIRQSAAFLHWRSSFDLLSCYVGDEQDLPPFLGEFRLNTERRPFVEFNRYRETHSIGQSFFEELVARVRDDSLSRHLEWSDAPPADVERWKRRFAIHHEAATHLYRAHRLGVWTDGLEHCADGLAVLPGYPPLLAREHDILSIAESRLDRPDRLGGAARAIEAILHDRPAMGSAWLVKSWIHQRRGEMQQAESAATSALRHAPSCAKAHENLAKLLFRSGRAEEALASFERAVRLMPDDAGLHFNYGIALSRQGRLDEAVAAIRRGLDLRPRHAQARALLAQLEASLPVGAPRSTGR